MITVYYMDEEFNVHSKDYHNVKDMEIFKREMNTTYYDWSLDRNEIVLESEWLKYIHEH